MLRDVYMALSIAFDVLWIALWLLFAGAILWVILWCLIEAIRSLPEWWREARAVSLGGWIVLAFHGIASVALWVVATIGVAGLLSLLPR